MKLNFWQILGLALLIAGGAWWAYNKSHPTPASNTLPSPAATSPVK